MFLRRSVPFIPCIEKSYRLVKFFASTVKLPALNHLRDPKA
jgi:hypothetical protein